MSLYGTEVTPAGLSPRRGVDRFQCTDIFLPPVADTQAQNAPQRLSVPPIEAVGVVCERRTLVKDVVRVQCDVHSPHPSRVLDRVIVQLQIKCRRGINAG